MANQHTTIARAPTRGFCAVACAIVALLAQGAPVVGSPVANPLGSSVAGDAAPPTEPARATGIDEAPEFVGPVAPPTPERDQPDAPTEAVAEAEAAVAPTQPLTESLPLGAPRTRVRGEGAGAGGAPASGGFVNHWLVRTVAALSMVIGLILLMRAVIRRVALGSGSVIGQLGAGGRAPSGVLSVLGRYPVARGQTLVLLRMDRRVLLLNQTSNGFTTLAEVTDPEEVASLLIKTRDDEGDSMAHRFGALLRRMERDPSIMDEGSVVEVEPRRFAESPAGAEPWPPARDPVGSIRRRLATLREGAR